MLQVQQSTMGGFNVEELDVSDSDALFERYGVRIPVLQHPDKRELDWPFSQPELRDFLASCSGQARLYVSCPTRTASTAQLAPCSTPFAVEPINKASP